MPPPETLVEYKPPSLLAQHKVLAAFFAILCVAFAVYCFRVPPPPHGSPPTPPTPAKPVPAKPIYVEPIDKEPAPG